MEALFKGTKAAEALAETKDTILVERPDEPANWLAAYGRLSGLLHSLPSPFLREISTVCCTGSSEIHRQVTTGSRLDLQAQKIPALGEADVVAVLSEELTNEVSSFLIVQRSECEGYSYAYSDVQLPFH